MCRSTIQIVYMHDSDLCSCSSSMITLKVIPSNLGRCFTICVYKVAFLVEFYVWCICYSLSGRLKTKAMLYGARGHSRVTI